MPQLSRFALLRPELYASLERGEAKIAALMHGSAQILEADEVLIEANTDHPYVYRLAEGWMCRTRALADGREQCILIFLPGEFFALKSMFVTRHPDDVRSVARAVVERIARQKLHEAYSRDVDIANRCTWQVMEEERRLHSWVVGLGQGSAEERMALLLIDFHGRLAVSGHITPETLTFEMPLKQFQLADQLWITSVHVSRVLKVFRDRRIVTVRDSQVTIHDLQELARTAQHLLDPYERARREYVGDATFPWVQ